MHKEMTKMLENLIVNSSMFRFSASLYMFAMHNVLGRGQRE